VVGEALPGRSRRRPFTARRRAGKRRGRPPRRVQTYDIVFTARRCSPMGSSSNPRASRCSTTACCVQIERGNPRGNRPPHPAAIQATDQHRTVCALAGTNVPCASATSGGQRICQGPPPGLSPLSGTSHTAPVRERGGWSSLVSGGRRRRFGQGLGSRQEAPPAWNTAPQAEDRPVPASARGPSDGLVHPRRSTRRRYLCPRR